jgi:Lrp/AsnC family transcriptional regulator, leucine-responsive regulatory protein
MHCNVQIVLSFDNPSTMPFDPTTQLDDTDWRLLRELQDDARHSYVELGRLVNLSRPAVAERMRRLEDLGVIVGYRAEIDLSKLGHGVVAFVRVNAQRGDIAALVDAVRRMPEVLECHRGSGEDALMMKVAVPSLARLEMLMDSLLRFGTVNSTVVLSNVLTKRIVTEGLETRSGYDEGGGI